MYVGHFAIGLALHEKNRDVPLFPILMGVGLLDVVEGIFLNSGLANVVPDLARGPYLFFDLTFIDWDHSLVMALFWSVLWGLLFRKNTTVALVAGFSVFTHYLADLPFHNHDMAVYPFSSAHWGFGLWDSLGVWSWVIEGVFSLFLLGYSWLKVSSRNISLFWPSLLLLAQFIVVSPWFSPMLKLAKLPMPQAQYLLGLSFVLSTIIPSLLLMWMLHRAEQSATR